MKNLNKKTEFDKHWEEVFQDAEIAPPDSVWSKIDSDLSKEEAGYFKRRVFMFKMLAAASIAFALGIGAFSLNYYMGTQPDIQVAQSPNQVEQDDNLNNADNALLAQEQANSNQNSIKNGNQVSSLSNTESQEKRNSSFPNSAADQSQAEKVSANQEHDNLAVNTIDSSVEMTLPLMEENEDNQQIGDQINEEPELVMASLHSLDPKGIYYVSDEDMIYEIEHIYMMPFMPRGASKKNRHNEEDNTGLLMASVDFSAGQFDPNFQQGGNTFTVPTGYVAADTRSEVVPLNATNKKLLSIRSSGQETKPELAYSYGANVGFKLSKRFLLQTGFAYRKANTTTSTTGYIYNPEENTRIPIVASYQYQMDGLSSVQGMDKTSLNNQYEFASIPIRAGYVVLNKKINLTLLAGISSEIFINNSISDDSNYLQSLSSNDASDSPYNNMYFNGTLGTMVGYSFARNYMVTVEPSYRMAINSFTKESFYLSSYPSSFMLSFGVAYNFR